MSKAHLSKLIPMALCVILCAGGAMAQVALIPALAELSTAADRADAYIKEQLAQALREKSLERFRERLVELRRTMHEAEQRIDKERALGEQKMKDLRGQYRGYGADPGAWPEEGRRAYTETETAVKGMDQLKTRAKGVNERITAVYAQVSNKDAQTFSRTIPTYIRWLEEIRQGVGNFKQGITGMQTAYPTAKASPLKVRNDSAEIEFTVAGQKLKPGQSLQVPMPADRKLVVEALPMTKRRDYVLNKALTRHASLNGERTPSRFSFVIDTGAGATQATWTAEKEEFTWNCPPHAKLATTHAARTGRVAGDTLVWDVPVVSKARFGEFGSQVFLLAVRGKIDWYYLREGAAPRKEERESEYFHGDLTVTVTPE